MNASELRTTLDEIVDARERAFQSLMPEFTREELAAAEDFLKRFGDGKTTLEKAVRGLRANRLRASARKRSRILVGGAFKALGKARHGN